MQELGVGGGAWDEEEEDDAVGTHARRRSSLALRPSLRPNVGGDGVGPERSMDADEDLVGASNAEDEVARAESEDLWAHARLHGFVSHPSNQIPEPEKDLGALKGPGEVEKVRGQRPGVRFAHEPGATGVDGKTRAGGGGAPVVSPASSLSRGVGLQLDTAKVDASLAAGRDAVPGRLDDGGGAGIASDWIRQRASAGAERSPMAFVGGSAGSVQLFRPASFPQMVDRSATGKDEADGAVAVAERPGKLSQVRPAVHGASPPGKGALKHTGPEGASPAQARGRARSGRRPSPAVTPVSLAQPYMTSLRIDYTMRPLAYLPWGLRGEGEAMRPPIKAGTYALVPMAAIAMHLRMLDSFETQRHVRPRDRRWYLSPLGINIMRAILSTVVALLPSFGRWMDGYPALFLASSNTRINALQVLAPLLTFIISAGYMGSFLVGLIVQSARLLWVMERLTALIETPATCCTEICNGWSPIHVSDIPHHLRRPVVGGGSQASTSDGAAMTAAAVQTEAAKAWGARSGIPTTARGADQVAGAKAHAAARGAGSVGESVGAGTDDVESGWRTVQSLPSKSGRWIVNATDEADDAEELDACNSASSPRVPATPDAGESDVLLLDTREYEAEMEGESRGLMRFGRPFTIDLRFEGGVAAFYELRRWIASAHAPGLKRIQWVYAFLLAVIVGVFVRVLLDSVNRRSTPFVFLLPGLFITGVAIATLLAYLLIGTKHNELLITHAHQIRKQELLIERQFEQSNGKRAAPYVWSLDPRSDAARAVRRFTSRWPTIRDTLRTSALLFDAEVVDIHVGPKMKLGNLAISRTLLRVIVSTTLSAALFIAQQSLASASAPQQTEAVAIAQA